MKINTGRGTIPLITLVGIWSVSALTSLPGLAVSPILGQLTTIFPHATELDIQMLTSLPSLLIIPFVLLAGKLAEKRDFVRLLKAGLWMFAASGVLYLFSDKMWQLMVVSALLGIGSGLIIPLSTGLVSRYFTGEYRVKQFGYSSAITNVTLVVATAVTGYLAEVNWHLPFVVYLLPLVSLLLVGYLKGDTGQPQKTEDTATVVPEESKRALEVVSRIAGRPADIKRVGPASLDLCKVADGTYDAYFEAHLHKWDVPAVSAGAVVVWEAQGHLSQWNGDLVHWRQENDVLATNGLIADDLRQYLA